MTDNAPYRFQKRWLDCRNLTLEEAEEIGEWLCTLQRDVMFHIGDLARYCEARWPDTWNQAFPPWASQGLIQRTAGVCRAYPNQEDRRHEATYSQYMQAAGKPNRDRLLSDMEGMTTDESRRSAAAVPDSGESSPTSPREDARSGSRWLLAVDVNYHVTRIWSSGAGVEAAMTTAQWIRRTVDRMKRDHNLTDVVCCMDSRESFRKELVREAEWEDQYKPRALKDPEHAKQIQLVEELLRQEGFLVVRVDGMEADDVMASYAKQFDGKTTLLTCDKDMRQCLSKTCNMLLDIEWEEDETSGQPLPKYKWVTAKSHTEGMTYNSAEVVGIRPDQWIDFQCLAGDSTDGISGAKGIGAKIAADLIKEFGTPEAAIEAAKAGDERIKPKKREALLEFEPRLHITGQLVTLRDDLEVPHSTRIA